VERKDTWVIGGGDPDPAAARFQVGRLRLDYYAPPGGEFDAARLPIPPLENASQLENAVSLVAMQLGDTTVHQGESLPVTLYWRALTSMDTSYIVFVQAINAEGVKAGQIDRPPCHGDCPTTRWRPGDLVGERYDLLVDAGAPPGRYQLITGMYDLATGKNLIWFDGQGNALGPHFLLGTLEVKP
jgi:hypothetical protein